MFEWNKITVSHQDIAKHYLGGVLREPDYSFLPGKALYQYRWYISPAVRMSAYPAVFLHIMTGDDPTGELHDHDWDNVSFVLGGRMIETYGIEGVVHGERVLTQGMMVARKATDTHSLRLESPYAMTLFTIGRKVMDNHYYPITVQNGDIF